MKAIKNKRKATFISFLLSVAYYTFCFFIFIFLINNVIIELITSGKIAITHDEFFYLSGVSLIVGIAAGCRVWIFAKIDERKARKTPPSDRN